MLIPRQAKTKNLKTKTIMYKIKTSQVSKRAKMQTKTVFYMLPARPGVVFGFTFAMSTRSPNNLSSGLEGFPDGT